MDAIGRKEKRMRPGTPSMKVQRLLIGYKTEKRRALSSWSQPDGNWSGTGSQRREKENEMR
jgi:hypothetical protein